MTRRPSLEALRPSLGETKSPTARPAITSLFLIGLVASPLACGALLGIEDVDGNDLDAGAGGAAASASASVGVGSGGTASGVASSSTGGSCVPGMMTPCYDGPVGTDNVGICKPGMAICGADGKPSGTCEGEVVPKPEDCSTPDDDDCNGKAADDTAAGCVCLPGVSGVCTTTMLGACGIGMGVCDTTGKAFVTCVSQPATFDDCATPADENCDGKTPPCSGTPDWLINGGANANSDDAIFAIAPEVDGTIVYGGLKQGTIEADGLSTTAGTAFFGKVDATGKNQFTTVAMAQVFGPYSIIRGLETAPDGSIFGVGNFTNLFMFPGGLALNSVGGEDVFLFRSSPAGVVAWTKSFGSTGADLSRGFALDMVNNHIYATGAYAAKLTVGPTVLTNAGGNDAFVVCYDLSGVPIWAKGFGGAGDQAVLAVAVASNGDIVVAGDFAGSMPIVGAPTLVSKGLNDIFVMRLAGANGAVVWAKSFGDAQLQTARSVAVAPNGDVLLAGGFAGTVNFGGSNLVAANADPYDAFAARFDSSGNHLWSRAFAGPSDQIASAITVDAGGEVVVAGAFSGSITFEGAPLVSAGDHDVFIAKLLGTDGTTLWKAGYGNAQEQFAWAVSTDPMTNVLFSGDFKSSLTLAPGISLSANGGFDAFLAKLAP